MKKILVVLILFAACKNIHSDKQKFYIVTSSLNMLISKKTFAIDSFYAPDFKAAYDTASKRYHANLTTHLMFSNSTIMPIEFALLDQDKRNITDSVPSQLKNQIDYYYYQAFSK